MAIKTNIVLDQGTDFEFSFELIDDNNQLIDVTGYSGTATMRKYYTSNTGYDFDVEVGPELAEVTLTMNNSVTALIPGGRYLYDCELTSPDGKVSRVMEGIVTINPRVLK